MTVDSTLRRLIRQHILRTPQLDTAEIAVSVTDGIVRLRGRVENPLLERLVIGLSKQVHGVRDVHSELSYGAANPDYLTRLSLEKRLRDTLEVPDGRVSVVVQDGVVSLKGIVRWNYQKEAALEVGRSAGLPLEDDIEVNPRSTNDTDKESVSDALRRDGHISCEDIEVVVSGQTVMLVGSVPSEEEKETAEEIVRTIRGVKDVKNALYVK